jgi:hypothetical protein
LWGTGPQGAIERLETISRQELEQLGLTYEIAKLWRDFYFDQTTRGRGMPTSSKRIELFNKCLQLLGDKETPTE